MKYFVYNSGTGEILREVSCSEEEAPFQCSGVEAFVPSVPNASDTNSYVSDGVVVFKSSQPSPHHVFDYTTKQWIDPRTLQDFKDAQWALIKQARTQAEYGGFTWDGSTFDSDAISQARITGAVSLAMMSPSFTIDWTLYDNTVRTLNQTEMMQVGAALGTHVAAQFSKGQALRAQIDAATTKEEVETVVWS